MTRSRRLGQPAAGSQAFALRCVIVGCIIVGLALAGCASVLQGEPDTGDGSGGPGSTPYEHAGGAEDVLVSIDSGIGYVPVQFFLRNTPEFLLLGDGTAIAAAPVAEIYPGPAILPLQSVTVTEDQIQELIRVADESGLLEERIEYGEPRLQDLPSTSVVFTVEGRTVAHSAYALGFDDDVDADLTDSHRAARRVLRDFIDTAHSLVGSDSRAYRPTGVVAHRVSGGEASPADPALEQEPVAWPIATVPPIAATDAGSCVAITGAEAAALLDVLERANELTPWLIGTEPATQMVFRPLLPGDPGCPP